MKKLLVIVFLFSAAGIFAQDKEDRNVRSFSKVRASEGIDVYMKKGSSEAVTVETEDIDIDRVITEVSGTTLKIHLDGYNNRGYDITVYVTFVELEEISASSAASIFVESVVRARDLELSSSSAGDIEIEVDADNVDIRTSSAADIQLSGKAGYVDASSSSAGEINAYDLTTQRARVRASSAGSVKITVTEEINADASSGGTIRYRGNPKKQFTDSSSGGSVKKVG